MENQQARLAYGRNMQKMERGDDEYQAIMGTTKKEKRPGGNKTSSQGFSGMGSSATGKKYNISSKKGGIGPLENEEDDGSWAGDD